MGIFDKFKTKNPVEPEGQKKAPEKAIEKTTEKKKPEAKVKTESKAAKEAEKTVKKPAAGSDKIKGKTTQSYRILVKPLVTEKASSLGTLNKYIFAVNPKMNKIEVKKAIRTVYNVEPLKVNISNFSGKNVRYGRIYGKTKGWKKAIVTLKPGDKIEVYEGV